MAYDRSALCCAGSGCVLVSPPSWCSGIRDESTCHKSQTEGRPCVWIATRCSKGYKAKAFASEKAELICPHIGTTTTKQQSNVASSPAPSQSKPAMVPKIKLNTGALMPMLAFGTGMLPVNSVREFAPRERMRHRSALPHLNTAIALNYTHIDTSEIYPDFDALKDVLRPHRHRLFITSKVDPTHRLISPTGTCEADGRGCDAIMLTAANETRQRLGLIPDLLLLHKPPPREPKRPGGNRSDNAAQCRRIQSLWRGLEAAQRQGLTRAIGLSNTCGHLLTCLARTAIIPPAVLQYMHRVGMGDDPFGYRAWGKRAWGSVHMAYSTLGGAELDFEKVTTAPAVLRVAKAHGGTHGANVALSWVAQLGLPLVVTSSSARHLEDDAHAFDDPPWRRLSKEEMASLSALREPQGNPSYWGDCTDERLAVERPIVEL